ncbi:MAG: SLBB domain-containing protein [bacterium]|jgi:hypothetical protein|nr:MAG: hypothetical protein DIU52_00650 [bacterium]
MIGTSATRGVLLAALVLAAAPGAVLSQNVQVAASRRTAAWDPAQLHMSRESLEELLARYEQATRSTAYSDELRARARYEAALIRMRLEEGDFQVGDQIQLSVEGHEELTKTFQVAPGRVLILPVIGEIPLRGVLRSELEEHLRKSLARYIVEPRVHATSTIRISILGQVNQPGFYTVPSEMLLTEALMLAGGPAQNAELTKIYIERGNDRIWGGEALQAAIIEGRTLDQLNLRAGDRIIVPGNNQNRWNTIRDVLFVLPPVVALLTVIF